MIIKALRLGDLDTNCYLVADESTHQAVIIDPADSGGYISEKILSLNLQPVAILLTHAHFDHLLGLLELNLNFRLPVYIHQADLFLVKQAVGSARHWLKKNVDPVPLPDHFYDDGDEIQFGHSSLKVIATPGHTPGSICMYSPGVLLSGDTLFRQGIGRTDFSYSSPTDLRISLDRLATLPGNTLVYPGHGEITTIGEEIK